MPYLLWCQARGWGAAMRQVQTVPELLRYFASVGGLVASMQPEDQAAESAAFVTDLEKRAHALEERQRRRLAGPPPPRTPPPISSGAEPSSSAAGVGQPQLPPSPPPSQQHPFDERRRAFALYDRGDGTVARADGWRILQAMGEAIPRRASQPSRPAQPAQPAPLAVASSRESWGGEGWMGRGLRTPVSRDSQSCEPLRAVQARRSTRPSTSRLWWTSRPRPRGSGGLMMGCATSSRSASRSSVPSCQPEEEGRS
jgi:hypothetical protein